MVILLVNVCVPAHTRAPLLLFWISEFELVCQEVSVFKLRGKIKGRSVKKI